MNVSYVDSETVGPFCCILCGYNNNTGSHTVGQNSAATPPPLWAEHLEHVALTVPGQTQGQAVFHQVLISIDGIIKQMTSYPSF